MESPRRYSCSTISLNAIDYSIFPVINFEFKKELLFPLLYWVVGISNCQYWTNLRLRGKPFFHVHKVK